MSTTDMTRAIWRKSTYTGNTGNCVEVADNLVDIDGVVGVRDSKNPTGPALVFDRDAFAAFIDEVKAGEFDLT